MKISEDESAEFWQLAESLADVARAETLGHFRSATLGVASKSAGFDPVTEADCAAEAAMRRLIGAHRPEDAILGEEYGAGAGTSGLTWVLDPIDGTRAYISGTPTWGVLIALTDGSGPRLGVIDQPYIGERFMGGLGRAEYAGPRGSAPLATRADRPLSDATVFTTFPEVGTPEEGEGFRGVASRARLTRYGMDCYAYALLAAGQIDLVIEAGLQPFDIQAPIAVVEAAGGIVTDWRGGDAAQGGRAIAAASRQVHEEALEILTAVPA